jgi:hypothetical protein
MKKARTFARKCSELIYDLVASTKEMWYAITELTHNPVINFTEYYEKCVITPVKAYSYNSRGDMEWGGVSSLTRDGEERILVTVMGKDGHRTDSIYKFSADEMVDIYFQLENIYRYEKTMAR